MGGPGSGWQMFMTRGGRLTTGSQHSIDIRWLKQKGYLYRRGPGYLSWSCRGEQTGFINYDMENDWMTLSYRIGDDKEQIEQVIRFDRTPCFFGGYRKWFLCPRCGKRVALLYGAGKYFLCRHCYDLTYDCKQEQPVDRLIRKQRKIQERLGGSGNLGEPILFKPKWMHQKTFDRLRNQADEANALSWGIMAERLG